MKALVLFFVVFSWTASVRGQEGKISSAKVTFEFPSKKVKGSIAGFESNSRIDWENPENSQFSGSVAVATLDTNNGLRNWSLRSSRYFNAKTYAQISFTSREVQKNGALWKVLGDLTIKGITKPFTLEFEEMNRKLVGRGNLYSSDFDIKIKKAREDNLVKVRLELQLTE